MRQEMNLIFKINKRYKFNTELRIKNVKLQLITWTHIMIST